MMTPKDYPELVELMAQARNPGRWDVENLTSGQCKWLPRWQKEAILLMAPVLDAMQAAGVVPVPVEATKKIRDAIGAELFDFIKIHDAVKPKTGLIAAGLAESFWKLGIAAGPYRRKE